MSYEPGYKGNGIAGGVCGCVAAAAFMVVVSFPFLFIWAWGGAHCAPVPECQRAVERTLEIRLAIIFALAVPVGIGIGFAVKWLLGRADLGGRAQGLAIAGIFALGVLLSLAYWQFWLGTY